MKHFCGENAETGEPTPPELGKVGYCGVSEEQAPLVIENGIWVCQSDSSWMDDK